MSANIELTSRVMGSTLKGHIIVLSLMKRVVLVTRGWTPEHVERYVDGPLVEDLDERVDHQYQPGKSEIILWTPRRGRERGHYHILFAELADQAIGLELGMMEASRADLYRMAKSLVNTIGEHPARADWYPDGWQSIVELIEGAGGA